MKEKFVPAGEIVNTHGINGEVKIQPWTDSAEFLSSFKTLYIDEKAMKVVSNRQHKGMLLVQFESIGNINDAMRLKGRKVSISRDDVDLPQGVFFIQDIIGSVVVDESGAEIGKLVEAMETPASMIYVVRGETEHLIPAVPEFVLKTDVEAGVVTVRLIEGM